MRDSRITSYIALVLFFAVLSGSTVASGNGNPSNYLTHRPCPAEWFQEAEFYVERGLIPGVLVVVDTPEWGLRIGSVGYADMNEGTRPDPSMRYRVGSVTQIMLSIVVLQLEHEGKLALDQTIDRLLGEGFVPNGDIITLRDCLRMRSGLFDYSQADIFKLTGRVSDGDYQPAEILFRVRESLRKESKAPDSGYMASSTGFLLAGMVVESIEKKHLDAVFAERIFKPFGMNDSFFPTSSDIPSPVARGYANMDSALTDCTTADPSTLGAANAVVSTPFDMLRFFRELFEGKRLLTPRSYRLMTHFAVTRSEEDVYSLGLMERISRRGTWRGCESVIPGYTVLAGYYMQGKAFVMVFVNTGENSFAAEDIFNAILRRVSGCPSDMTPAIGATLDSQNGKVRFTWQSGFIYGDAYRVYIGSDRSAVLAATKDNHAGITMIETDGNTYQAEISNLKRGITYYWRVEAFREVPKTELENARLWRDTERGRFKQLPWKPVPEFECISSPDYSFTIR